MLENAWAALAITFILAIAWLRLNDFLAHKEIVSGSLSRKIIHIGTGPIFVLCWLLFPDILISRYLAAIVPLLITIQFALVGLGIIKDQAAIDAMSRTGDRKEILRGPLIYGITFVVLTLIFWKSNLNGIVALMLLCGGDGLADIIGSKVVNGGRLPWSRLKTWAGSIAMFFGGFLLSILVAAVYVGSGTIGGSMADYILKIILISMVTMLVESLPFRDIDNLTVPVSAILLGFLLKI